MKRKGFTLVEIMIVVTIIALVAAIVIPNLVSARRAANQAAAKANVRNFATAAETFAISHAGAYPSAITGVTNGSLVDFMSSAASFCAANNAATTVQGYNYRCALAASGYTFTAEPQTLNTSGNYTYTATTGAVISPLN